uniref:Chitin-binding type-2 domain-containing protein n=1 Tax=Phlebotomus papatasi TaxID=29031 RepID=A0A1B0DLW1_PHLPP
MEGIILGIVVLISAVSASSVIYPCPETGIARLPHATSCTRYIQCISGIPVVRHCAEGLRFSTINDRCRTPDVAGCGHDEFLCPLFDDPENLVYLSDNENCSIYFLCHNGVPERFECDPGLQWNIRDQKCDFPDRANCRLVNIDCPESGFTVVPHPYNCDRFFRCVNGRSYEARCPDEMSFDVIRGECYDRNSAKCFEPSPPVSTTPNPPLNTTAPTPPINTTPETTTVNTTPTPPLNTTPTPRPTPPVSTTPQYKGNVESFIWDSEH